MDLLSVVAIAFGLAMDCFAVGVSSGISRRRVKWSASLMMALSFGFFQAGMPLVGYAAGTFLERFIVGFDHWIALGLLSMIGIKMIREAFAAEDGAGHADPFAFWTVIVLSLATSIDALAVGLSFAFLSVPVLLPCLIIGTVTIAVSFAGIQLGSIFGSLYKRKAEIVGGLILIVIGLKIFIEHLCGRG